MCLSSAALGVGHFYRGISGVLDASIRGVWYGLLYFAGGRNLWVSIVAHGTNNTLGLTFMFLGYGP